MTAEQIPEPDIDLETEIEVGVSYRVDGDGEDLEINGIYVCGVNIIDLLPEGMQKQALRARILEACTADVEARIARGDFDDSFDGDDEPPWDPDSREGRALDRAHWNG